MAPFLPVTLVGDNLGQRHRHLNSLVREAKESEALFQDVVALPEESAVDRLFKIDLARELKHVDYIIRNLKDDDMLYVSRALKATWLIDHRDIINPKYLEDVLFPEMITPAVTKMKHWLYVNLRDPATSQEFYQYYKENTFEFAIKFLSHCSHEFLLEEASKILSKLSAHSLKVLCEKCPKVAKIYFDSLATDEGVKTRYLGQDRSYYNSVKCVLKSDADVFLDITEKYFNMNNFGRFSPLATDYILRCHKTRFTNKSELYVAYFLHIPTLAARLSVDECQNVVVKLARASYLRHWFEYKVVEPLIKRLSPDKRAAFKKLVFVDKDVGDCVDKWSYDIPVPPMLSVSGPHIFDDKDVMSEFSLIYPPRAPGGCQLFCAPAKLCAAQPQSLNNLRMIRVKTDLDRLFDEFRFKGFERALNELGQRLVATASPDRRRDIFIVLVSKTGGRTDAVSALLRLAAKYSNEPPHTRAAILRSLVKRANVWRLPHDIWQHLLDYGHGLGLDGTRAEAACREGLHAVVIRQLLAGECKQAVRDAFMNDFSTLVEYSLKVDERARVVNGLQNMLAAAATDVASKVAAVRLQQLLDVLKIYRIRVEPTSPAVKAVMALALRNADVARPLLQRLYCEKIGRRELLRLNMEFRRDEAALLNALRHDPSLLNATRVADTTPSWNCWQRNLRCFKPRPIVLGTVTAPPQNFGTSNVIVTGFRFDNPAAPVPGGSPTPRPMHFGMPVPQNMNFRRNPNQPTRFRMFGARQANVDSFISKLVIYFHEKQDFTTDLCTALKKKLVQGQNIKLARPLASLFGNNFEKELHAFDAAGKESVKFAAALRACAHRARPVVNLAEWGWRKAGVKAVATRAMRCREIERAALTRVLAAERRTVRVALALSMRSASGLLLETFASTAKLRPAVALRIALPYFRRHGFKSDLRLWDIIKPLISNVNLESRERLRHLLGNTAWIPSTIKADYCISLYRAIYKFSYHNAQKVLRDISKCLPECDECIETILLQMLDDDTDKDKIAIPYPTIFVRYLLLSKNEEDVERRFMKIGNRFLERLDTLRSENDSHIQRRLSQMMESLKYNAAFLDIKYTSCLSVIERILAWTQKFMPKEKYFEKYVQIHLTMLYFKAVRQGMKQMPEVFADPNRRKSEGVEAVGFVFGRYIMKELAELVSTYFDSIIELYADGLIKYLSCNLMYGSSRNIFIGFVLKGILTEAIGIQRRVAVYVLRERQIVVEESVKKEIEELIMKDQDLQLFANTELFSHIVSDLPFYIKKKIK